MQVHEQNSEDDGYVDYVHCNYCSLGEYICQSIKLHFKRVQFTICQLYINKDV